MNKFFLMLTVVLVVCIQSCTNQTKIAENTEKIIPYVNPPLKKLDIPYSQLEINVGTGKTINRPSGATLNIPPNAFVDSSGKVIEGNVTLDFREFLDPLDFFVSGIPMQYDSGGTTYTFESDYMCELKPIEANKKVLINPNAIPTIEIPSNKPSTNYKPYLLDTTAEKWVLQKEETMQLEEVGISEEDILPMDVIAPTRKKVSTKVEPKLIKPMEPKKANQEQPIFSVSIPYVDRFPELKIFKNAQFEIDKSEKNYDPKEANYEWDKVDMEKTETEGVYKITFSMAERFVSYRVRPVFEGKDYAAALQVFHKKQAEYKAEKDSLIAEREKEIAELERQYQEQLVLYNKRREEIRKSQEKHNAIVRTLEIANFGYWNIDRISKQEVKDILVEFTDEKNQPLPLQTAKTMSPNLNGIFTAYANKIKVLTKEPMAIWGVLDTTFYYLSTKEFPTANIKDSEKLSLVLHSTKEDIKDYHHLRNLLGLPERDMN